MNVSIVGATGYGGMELIRFLNNHPQFKIKSLHTSSQFGRSLSEENAHLMHMIDKLEEIDPEAIAKKSQELGIKDVVFDRSGYLYHGRIKAVAEGAREGGLNF